MNNTSKKIDKIISEIEDFNNNQVNVNGKKTISQVIDLLLNKSNTKDLQIEKQNTDQNTLSQFKFDMDELSYWKDRNNQYYKIDYYRNIISYRKHFTKVIVFIKRIIRKMMRFLIEPILLEQNDFNASVTSSINALYNNAVVTQEFMNQFTALKQQNDSLQDQINKKNEDLLMLPTLMDKLDNVYDKLNEFYNMSERMNEIDYLKDEIQKIKNEYNISRIEQLELFATSFQNDMERNNDEYAALNKHINQLRHDFSTDLQNEVKSLEFKLQDIELHFLRTVTKLDYVKSEKPVESTINKDENTYSQIDYFSFENNFRGLRKDIKDAQKIYVDYFINKGHIIDLGCGRGEFLELMKENNISVTGVDLYEEFVDYCNINDLSAVYCDAIEYLANLQNNTIGGVFASQLVEHLNTNQLIQLCNEAYKKLLPGSYLILETPNPTSLSIYMNAFYMDPSHNKPVHPKTLEYFLKQAGFSEISVVFTEQSKVGYKLPLLEGQNINNLNEFNDGINLLSDIIFGSQDYAIIAKK